MSTGGGNSTGGGLMCPLCRKSASSTATRALASATLGFSTFLGTQSAMPTSAAESSYLSA